ncbi:MAG: hypothetical protein LC677_05675 [Halomonas sp.]|nr:hypothetical protein [Halomonas sp.]
MAASALFLDLSPVRFSGVSARGLSNPMTTLLDGMGKGHALILILAMDPVDSSIQESQ